jgi:hypothetical protein
VVLTAQGGNGPVHAVFEAYVRASLIILATASASTTSDLRRG